jgi:hypothetical protein
MTTASESCDTTSQMSLFGETCADSRAQMLLHTPTGTANQLSPSMATRDAGSWGLTSSPQAIPASHSHSPGSDWARRMTATYGRKLSAYWLNCDPPDSWARTLLGISTWASTTCYLTWKKSVTPAGRLLFRLVPSTPRTAGIGSGLWPTPNVAGGGNTCELTPHKGHYLRPSGEKAHLGLDQAAKMWPTPKAGAGENRLMRRTPSVLNGTHGKHLAAEACEEERELGTYVTGMKLNSAWVSRLMGYPDNWLTLDGEATQ